MRGTRIARSQMNRRAIIQRKIVITCARREREDALEQTSGSLQIAPGLLIDRHHVSGEMFDPGANLAQQQAQSQFLKAAS